MMTKTAQLICLAPILLFLGACSKKKEDPKPFMTIIEQPLEKTVSGYFHFQYYYGEKPLILDSVFVNFLGQKFKFDTISFFLSDLTLMKENGTKVLVKNSTVFENHITDLSQNLVMKNVPVGDYMSVSFSIGLPAELNQPISLGAESNFMHYGEKTQGYSFLLISGHLATDPNIRLRYMIGTNELLRKVSLPLKPFTVFEGQTYFFHYNVNLAPLLYNLNFESEKNTNSLNNKPLALSIANKISTAFSYGTHH